MKKILLLGINGVYNYGCEAIVRGTENIIKEFIPDAVIDYASYRVEDDIERLHDCDVNIISRPLKRFTFKNFLRKILTYFGVELYFSRDSYALVKNYDAVFSIGGDIYTLSPDGSAPYSLMKLGDLCERKGIRYILWGCSVGPFDESKRALKAMKKHLAKISLIVAREERTIKYLRGIGIEKNVVFAPDPAFLVGCEIKRESQNAGKINRIGINLSPLSAIVTNRSVEESIKLQVSVIVSLLEKSDAEIYLVPHVICDFFENDDDFRYLEKIKDKLPSYYQERVTLMQKDIGFIETKKRLMTCDVVVAARMHCAINSSSAGISTILLSYSEKAKGMSEFIYGNTKYVIPVKEFSSISEKIEEISNSNYEIGLNIDIKLWKEAFSRLL